MKKYLNKKIENHLSELPQGWKYIEGATTAPRGYRWANNGKSLFSSEYRRVLIKIA